MTSELNCSAGILYLLAIAVLCLVASGRVDAQTPAGAISELAGHADLKRGSSTVVATLGMQLEVHDEITTSAGGRMTLALSDGSKVYLSESTDLVIDEHVIAAGGRARSVISVLDGHLRSLVSAALGGVFNYEIHTPNSIVAVAGTDFDVEFTQGSARPGFSGCEIYTDVGVRSGVVQVANVADPTMAVKVDGGYATTVPCLDAPLSPGPLGLAGTVNAGVVAPAPPPQCPVCPPGR